jgi:hypothetical protein
VICGVSCGSSLTIMNPTIEYFARQVAGSRLRLSLAILCQIGAFVFLVSGLGWRSALEFGFFMVFLPVIYLGIIHGMIRNPAQRAANEAES